MFEAQSSFFSKHTQIEEVKVINWGVFNNPGTIKIATEKDTGCITMLSGEGGTGKSNLIDAIMFVLGDPHRNDFNKNAGSKSSGKNPRNAYTYTRGYIKDYGTGKSDDNFLRRTPCWSAVSVTAATYDGTRYTMARFSYVPYGGSASDCNSRLWAFAQGNFDIALAEKAANAPFTPGSLKEALGPNVIVKDSGTQIQKMWQDATGCTPDSSKLHRLLGNPDGLKTPTDIFKNLSEDETGSVDKARKIVEDFEKYKEADAASKAKIKTNDDVDNLIAKHEEAKAIEGKISRLYPWAESDRPNNADRTILRKWMVSKNIGILEKAASDASITLAEKKALYEAAEKARKEQNERYLDAEKRLASLDIGKSLSAKETERNRLEEEYTERRTRRNKVQNIFSMAKESIPENAAAWAKRKSVSEIAAKDYASKRREMEGFKENLSFDIRDKEDEVRQARFRLANAENTRSRITKEMKDDLDLIRKASGLDSGAVIYEAQLFDLTNENEKWRMAMNAAWGKEARTLLVDGDETEFRKNIESIDPNLLHRVHFKFVDVDRRYPPVQADSGMLSSMLRFDENSRFYEYVKTRLSKIDYLCVESAADFVNADIPQLSLSGQTRQKHEGWYGNKGRKDTVIGFVSGAYIQELRGNLSSLETELSDLETKKKDIDEAFSKMDDEQSLWRAFENFEFNDIDADGTAARLNAVEREIETLKANPTLEARSNERDTQKELLDKTTEKANRADNDRRQAEYQYGQYNTTLKARTNELAGFEGILSDESAAPWAMFEQEIERLALSENGFISMLLDNNDLLAKTGQIERNIVEKRDSLRNSLNGVRRQLEQQMRQIRENDIPETERVKYGTDYPGSYPAYVALKEKGDIKDKLNNYRALYLDGAATAILDFMAAKEYYKKVLRQTANDFNTLLENEKSNCTPEGEHMKLTIRFEESDDHKKLNRMLDDFKKQNYFKNDSEQTVDVAYYKSLGENEINAIVGKLERIVGILGTNKCESVYTDPKRSMRVDVELYKIVNGEHVKTENVNFAGNNGSKFNNLTTSIIVAAICFAVGHTGGLPNYAPLFMDESFVKSDNKSTAASIELLRNLGFQVILSCPEQKQSSIGPYAKKIILVRRPERDGYAKIVPYGDVEPLEQETA